MTVLRRSFLCLNMASFLGAFNDNAIKVLTCLLAMEWVRDPSASASWIAFAGGSFVVPYLIFSMMAGSLADRFSKSRLFVLMQWMEVPVMALGAVGLAMRSLPCLVFALFLTGTQSALFSPAKYGLLPEIFSQDRLAWANGVVEVMIFAGILAGTLAGSFSVSFSCGHPAMTGIFLILLALAGALVSMGIGRTARMDPAKKLCVNPVGDVWREWKILRQNKLLSLATEAIGYFWFLGALVQLNALSYARSVVGVGPRGTGVLLTALAVGVGAGSYMAGKFSGKAIRLIPVRLGIAGVAVCLFFLACPAVYGSFGIAFACLLSLGLCGGHYIVPLNTLIQARSPATDKGRVIAATNFFAFSGILLASAILWLLGSALALNPAAIFLIASVLSAAVAVPLWLRLPRP